MNVNEFVRFNASTSQTTPSNANPDQYNHGYHDGYTSGVNFGMTFAVDRVLEIIDKIEREKKIGYAIMDGSMLCNTKDFREMVLELKGGEQ